MSKVKAKPAQPDSSAERADEVCKRHQEEIYRNTDQLFARLMFLQLFAGIIAAFFISPRTWSGVSSQVHVHVWAAILGGSAITIFPVWMTRAWPGAAVTRHVMAVAQMLMSCLLIRFNRGRIAT